MVTVDIKSVQQMLQKEITFGNTKCLSKKIKIICDYRYSIKMCFFQTYILARERL